MRKFTFLGQEILPGKSYDLHLDIANLHTRTPIVIPVIVERGKEDGPVVLLMAGLHGDEINGIEIVRRFIKKGLNKPHHGTIICLPVFNIFGFLNLKREMPDGRDLNRSFPGTKNGSLASQFAYQFMHKIAPHVDLILDFHTGSAQRSNFSQLRVAFSDEASLELAKVFNAPMILNSSHIAKTIREEVTQVGIKMLLFEGGKANSVDECVVEEGIQGIKNILQHLGMRSFKMEQHRERSPILLQKSKWMRAAHSGMFHSSAQNGAQVKKGEIIGAITDPYGKFERKVKAASDGHIICLNESPVVYKGDAIFHIGME
ncbi:MAG: succinylglutamate desuccinylase/aspartoacylase family protein [Bacteroidota bacterium]